MSTVFVDGVAPTGIKGCMLIERAIIKDDRGAIAKLWREDQFPLPAHVAEVYLSSARPMAVKAWHLHSRMTLRYICLQGRVMVALVDGRNDSPTYGIVHTTFLTDNRDLVGGRSTGALRMLVIPPGVWNGYRGMVGFQQETTIINLPDMVHDPDEIRRIPPAAFVERADEIVREFGVTVVDALASFQWGAYEVAG